MIEPQPFQPASLPSTGKTTECSNCGTERPLNAMCERGCDSSPTRVTVTVTVTVIGQSATHPAVSDEALNDMCTLLARAEKAEAAIAKWQALYNESVTERDESVTNMHEADAQLRDLQYAFTKLTEAGPTLYRGQTAEFWHDYAQKNFLLKEAAVTESDELKRKIFNEWEKARDSHKAGSEAEDALARLRKHYEKSTPKKKGKS